MRLVTLRGPEKEEVFLKVPGGLAPLLAIRKHLDPGLPTELMPLIQTGRLEILRDWFHDGGWDELARAGVPVLPQDEAAPAPPFRHPRKIWGIGLNYAAHAAALAETAPTFAPASFMKPDTTIIGPGDPILLPPLAEKVTAEAELALVIGRKCRDVPRERWLDVVAGFVPVLDMTAEDLLRRNPRYLTLAKCFDTFLSMGPELVTPDEVDDLGRIRVATVLNGVVAAEDAVAHMTFAPDLLVAFHSQAMTLLPGDVITTGTPGAVQIRDGDVVECRITGFDALVNPVGQQGQAT